MLVAYENKCMKYMCRPVVEAECCKKPIVLVPHFHITLEAADAALLSPMRESSDR